MPDIPLGPIVRLQVQREPLKEKGVGYDPNPILSVDEATLDADGMRGLHDDGWVVDAHNRNHPRARGGGRRALSIGFTGHYAAMADRFGSAPIGVAGENIIVERPGRIGERDLGGVVVIATADGEIALHSPRVAAPCAEFTSFLKGLDHVVPKSEQAADVDFLDGGTRGFILQVDHLDEPARLRVGDQVVLRR